MDGQADLVARPGRASAYDVTDPVYQQAAEAGLDDVATMQLVDINTWLPGDILVKADRMSMAHGLELRVAVPGPGGHDRRVPALPGGEDGRAGPPSSRCARPWARCCRRRWRSGRSSGFPCRSGQWLAGEWFGFADEVLREAQTDRWIDREAALALLHRYRAGEPDVSWRQLWALIVFSIWHQNLRRARLRPRAPRLAVGHPLTSTG